MAVSPHMTRSSSPRSLASTSSRSLLHPTLITYKHLRFLITDAPCDANLSLYIQEFKKHNVTDVVRACEPTYSTDLVPATIKVHELNFKDGDPPPENVIKTWLQIVSSRFSPLTDTKETTIAVHCVAGLGRAPVLVAIALIEAGMKNLDAIESIRQQRRGAINTKQIGFLCDYKRKTKKNMCVLM